MYFLVFVFFTFFVCKPSICLSSSSGFVEYFVLWVNQLHLASSLLIQEWKLSHDKHKIDEDDQKSTKWIWWPKIRMAKKAQHRCNDQKYTNRYVEHSFRHCGLHTSSMTDERISFQSSLSFPLCVFQKVRNRSHNFWVYAVCVLIICDLKLLAHLEAKSHTLHLFDFIPEWIFKWVFKLPAWLEA